MPDRADGDGGTGMLSTVTAVMIFLVFLLFSVQLLVGLSSRSAVTSTAYDGARQVAGHRGTEAGGVWSAPVRQRAEARMIEQLGPSGARTTFDWSASDAETVVLRVQVDAPRFLSMRALGPLATDHIDRTVRVRVEREQ